MKLMPMLFGALLAALCSPVGAQVRIENASALDAAVAAERARAPATRITRGALQWQPALTAATLSPDGQRVGWLRESQTRREVWMQAGDAEPRRLLSNTSATQLRWSGDGRWLLLHTPREVFALAAAGQTGSRMLTPLGGTGEREWLGVDPGHPAAILVLEQHGRRADGGPQRWQLWRIAVDGARRLLHEDRQRLTDIALDARGRPAWLQHLRGDALITSRVGDDGTLHQALRCEVLVRCSLLGAATDGGLWLRGNPQGDLSGVWKLHRDGRLQRLHVDPHAQSDLDHVTLDAAGQPRIASYLSSGVRDFGLDAATQSALQQVRRHLPGRELRIEIGGGASPRWLVRERDSTLQGSRWHEFTPQSGALSFLFDDMPLQLRTRRQTVHVPEAATARKLAVRWRASDGMVLHGWLSLPPGRDPARLPLVVLAHGGPWNHALPGFNGIVQLLANRGYAVFEPNFRGSTGFGHGYVLAANGDFGNGRVQQDFVDGTQALLAHGVGDATRVGIIGGSFGGYSTLLGVTFQPHLFRVGVALAPPPDFAWTLRWILRNPEALQLSTRLPMQDWLRALSLDVSDRATMTRLHAQSPLANVDKMDRPLLIVAGGKDQRVGLPGVIEYAARLKLAGKDISLLVDNDAGHNNDEPIAREATLYLIEQMLHRHLGGDPPDAPDGEIRSYLRKNQRMPDHNLASHRQGGTRPANAAHHMSDHGCCPPGRRPTSPAAGRGRWQALCAQQDRGPDGRPCV